MRKFKRLSAIILSFSILLSFCQIGFSVSAETQSQGEWIHQGSYADMPSEIPFSLSDGSIGAAVSGKTIDYAEGYTNLLAGKEYEIFVYKNDIYKIDTIYGGATWDRMNDNLYNLTDISYDENDTVGEIVFHNENTCASQTNLISTDDNTIVRYVAIRYINPVTTTYYGAYTFYKKLKIK